LFIFNGTKTPIQEAVSHFFSGIATNINGLATNINGNISVNITLDSTAHEKMTTVKQGRNHMILPVYTGSDDISGQI
jgi:cell division protein FtsX